MASTERPGWMSSDKYDRDLSEAADWEAKADAAAEDDNPADAALYYGLAAIAHPDPAAATTLVLLRDAHKDEAELREATATAILERQAASRAR